MVEKQFALHETMEVHELLAFKNVCMTKSTTLQKLVSDPRLADLLQTCAVTDSRHIQELQGLLTEATVQNAGEGAVQG